ncbi:MAG: right-handed parallel beta-helix repeat-containing protein [Chloroflexi bacterium]|nr:right-handed parallel beta-helix repeat-containing protein [Chloroflexota bacterium]
MTVVRECISKLGFALLVLLLALVALPFVQASPGVSAETGIAEYGAGANDTGNPIGGGAGYTRIADPDSASFYVSTRSELLSAFTKAVSGQTIYIADSAQIDLTGYKNISVPAGVTLASGRGRDGSLGGLIYTNERKSGYGYNKFFKTGANVRITGIRLRGPDSEIGSSTYTYQVYSGIVSSSSGKIEVDNCEIYNWSEAGVMVALTREGYVHHNSIHHCRRTGLGYGVAVAGGTARVEANLFDYNRHSIMGTRDYPVSSYDAYYNIIGPNASNTMLDMHGGNDSPSWGFADGPDASVPAGGTILIHHNTFRTSTQTNVAIRGIPATTCRVYNNWTYWPSTKSSVAFVQRLENLGLKPYVKMSVYDNWYGTTAPPTSGSGTPDPTPPPPDPTPAPPPTGTTNRAPLAPPAASGTVKGWAGTPYTYSTLTTDPDGDTLRYTFYWGDGSSTTTGVLNSGATASASHTWAKPGTYWIYVKATDSRGASSSLSRSLVVGISSSGTAQVAPSQSPGDMPAAPGSSDPAAEVPDAGSEPFAEPSEPAAPANAAEPSNDDAGQPAAAPAAPVTQAVSNDPDADALDFNLDYGHGRSTRSLLQALGIAQSVVVSGGGTDGSDPEATPSEDTLPPDEHSGGIPIWALAIVALAGLLAVGRLRSLVAGSPIRGD